MVLQGITMGLLAVLALTRVMTSLLFETSPLDPLALAIACFCVIGIGLVAGFLPAHRATRVDPALTLRNSG